MTNLTIEDAARELVRAIYGDPVVPDEPRQFPSPPSVVTERQSYRNGCYSVRDLPEFKRLQELLKGGGSQETLPPGLYVCKTLDVKIEPGKNPGDARLMMTLDVVGHDTKLKVEAASFKGGTISEEIAKKLVQHIVVHMERESAFLQPNPQTFMNDPYELLDLIRNEAKLPPEMIDAWMLEAQPGKRLRG